MGSFASTRRTTSNSSAVSEGSAVTNAPIRWVKGALIGTGAFGKVYLGLNTATGHLMAVKEIDVDENTPESVLIDLRKEIKLMAQLSHPNIVRYLGFTQEKSEDSTRGTCHIYMEYVPGGSLAALLKKFGRFNEILIRLYTLQMLKGLEYLHSHNIIHRDIKGANVLMDKDGSIKLADFGASKQLSSATTHQSDVHSLRGTPYYMAPEAIKQDAYGRKADIWSLGCTVVQMITGKHPWSECHFANPAAAMLHIASTQSLPFYPDTLSDNLKDFLSQCLTRDPVKRKSASELLEHPFFTDTSNGNDGITTSLITSRERTDFMNEADLSLCIGAESVEAARGHYDGKDDEEDDDNEHEQDQIDEDLTALSHTDIDPGTVRLWSNVVAEQTTRAGMTSDIHVGLPSLHRPNTPETSAKEAWQRREQLLSYRRRMVEGGPHGEREIPAFAAEQAAIALLSGIPTPISQQQQQQQQQLSPAQHHDRQ